MFGMLTNVTLFDIIAHIHFQTSPHKMLPNSDICSLNSKMSPECSVVKSMTNLVF
jgi:hypothetical protein